jgi:hypothetical protein
LTFSGYDAGVVEKVLFNHKEHKAHLRRGFGGEKRLKGHKVKTL